MRKKEEMAANRIGYADVEKLIKEGKKDKKGSEVLRKLDLILS